MSKNGRKRRELVKRDGLHCQICKKQIMIRFPDGNVGQIGPHSATLDHIQPKSKGGIRELDNLQLLCPPCNQTKGSGWGGGIAAIMDAWRLIES